MMHGLAGARIKTLLSWAAVVLWMAAIFMLSSQPAQQSNELSKSVAGSIIRGSGRATTESGGGAKPDLSPKMLAAANEMLRGYAHAAVFFMLAALVLNAFLRNWALGVKTVAASLVFCAIYALLDEAHQEYVPGRGAQAGDFLLDCAGIAAGLVVYYIIALLTRKIASSKSRNVKGRE